LSNSPASLSSSDNFEIGSTRNVHSHAGETGVEIFIVGIPTAHIYDAIEEQSKQSSVDSIAVGVCGRQGRVV
jgi:hypothetical protein